MFCFGLDRLSLSAMFEENAATPYAAAVSINDMQYGVGYGTSKKQAKSEAARATLEILIPEMRHKIMSDSKTASNASKVQDQDLSVSNRTTFYFFFNYKICTYVSYSMRSKWKIRELRNFVPKLPNRLPTTSY